MSLRPLASLLVKMLGLYAVVSALPILSGILSAFAYPVGAAMSPVKFALFNASGGALQMLVGIGLWMFSDGIAHSAVPQDGEVAVRRDEGLMAIGFSVVGIYLVTNAAVKLAQFAATRSVLGASSSRWSVDMYINLHVSTGDAIVILVQAALGAYLLLGARGLVRGVANMRNIGRDPEVESAS